MKSQQLLSNTILLTRTLKLGWSVLAFLWAKLTGRRFGAPADQPEAMPINNAVVLPQAGDAAGQWAEAPHTIWSSTTLFGSTKGKAGQKSLARGNLRPNRVFGLVLLLGLSVWGAKVNAANETISAGSFIINMGVVPQTTGNGLKPYGMIYDLVKNYQVPIKWVIKPGKVKDGADFTYNGTDFKGGPFIIPAEYRNAAVNAAIASWQAQGVVGVTTTSAIIVPVYLTIDFTVVWTLDDQNGGIAQGYLTNAGIPATAYNWNAPGTLTCCDDIFVMPHADPEWNGGIGPGGLGHGRLYNWTDNPLNNPNGCNSSVWAACHAVSALELMFNPANPSQQTNFLSTKTGTAAGGGPWADPNNSLIEWGNHDENGPPYDYFLPTHPVMQFMGNMDAALQNGSEQSYLPVIGANWRPTTQLGVKMPVHPDVPSSSLGPAMKVVFGDAFGDANRGKVMYEAGHSHSGSAPANIAAQRAFLNFSIWAAQIKAIHVSVATVPPSMEGGNDVANLTATATGSTGIYTYQWSSDCPGTFSNPNGKTTTFTPDFVTEGVPCAISVLVKDDCATRSSFSNTATTIVPAPVPPIANDDTEFTNPGVPVTLPPLDNDTDLNLDLDPSTLTFWNNNTMMPISSPFVTANNGTFTINFDKTVTYVSDPGFTGTEVIYYRICDMTPVTETPPGPYCDVATITITVDNTDEFGCTPTQQYKKLYTAYGVSQTSNAFTSGGFLALGYPEGLAENSKAELNANATPASRGVITLTLGATVLTGDTVTIHGWAQDGNPTTISVSSSDDGITFSDVQNYTVPNSSQSYSFSYVVANPDGILFVRVSNTNSSKKFRLDGISYGVKDCRDVCALPLVDLVLSGTADANAPAGSTAANPARALGLPNLDGSEIDLGEILYVDLSDTIPAGEVIQLFLANDSQNPDPTIDVSGSLDGITFFNVVNYIPVNDRNEAFDQSLYTVDPGTQPNGIRYLRFLGNVAKSYVDAVVYDIQTCEAGVPVANNDVTYTIEGFPVTYPVQVNDYDPQGDPITTTAILSPPTNGTAVINPNGTITYTPNADFNGTDVLTYQICDATGLCDDATLTIIIPNDGCTDPAIAKVVGTGYGFTAAGNAGVTNPVRAVGIADALYAELDQNVSATLTVTLSETVFAGDTIYMTVSGQDANPVNFTVEISTNGTTWVGAQSYTVSGTTFVTYAYIVNNAAGANYIRFINNSTGKKLRVDAVRYNMRECLAPCTLPQVTNFATGYAVTATGDRSPLALTGAPDFVGQEIRLADVNPTIVDLGQIIPQGSIVYLYLANNNGAAGTLEVQKSPTNGSYANASTFSPTSPSAVFQQHSFSVTEVSGIRYLRLDVTAGDRVFIDAVQFAINTCVSGAPIAVNDVTTTLQETPVTYPVKINDSDPQNDPLIVTITSPPTNGVAVVNPDGTITYTPNNDFSGTDVLTYQICDPTNLCATATLTITVPSIDGCGPGQTAVIVGTGYGFTAAGVSTDNPVRSVGIKDGQFANVNNTGTLTLTLSDLVVAGDSIIFWVSGQDADAATFDFEVSNNGTTWVGLQGYSVSGTVMTRFAYPISGLTLPAGANFVRFTSTDASDDTRVDNIEYNLRECVPTGCVKSTAPLVQSGYAVTATGDRSPLDLTGAPNFVGQEIRLADVNPTIVDLGQIIPQGSIVYLYLANNNGAAGTLEVQKSPTNGSYANASTFSPTSPSAIFQQFSFTVTEASGIRYLRLDCTAGDRVFIDAIQWVKYQTNSVGGYVWGDTNKNGMFNGGEPAFAGVSVQIYEDVDNSGTVNAGDILLSTQITNAQGYYAYQFFPTSLPKNYVMRVVESTLPASPVNNFYTTAQYQTANFTAASQSDCANNFGRAYDNPPVAVNDVATTEQNVPIVITVLTNDSEPDGEILTVTSISSPPSAGGTVSINPDGTINYAPPFGYIGTETFSYVICDQANPAIICDTATVTVTVNPFVNNPPVAVNDVATTEINVPVTVVVLTNDSDPEGDPITPPTCVGTNATAGMPAVCNGLTTNGGTVTILPSGEIYYVPPPGFTGTDVTTYVICDPGGLCDDATITFTVVAGINDPPVATNDTKIIYQPCGATTFSVIGNDYDTDGNIVPASITITSPLSPATGTLVNNFNGTFTYTPAAAGTFTFGYTICDDGTPLPAQCDAATVTITVPAVNTAPTAVDDGDVISSNQQLTTPVLSNDSDPEAGILTVTLCPPPFNPATCGLASSTSTQGGTVVVLPSKKIQYTPPTGFAGVDTYFYQICDDGCPNLCDQATVTVTVENQPPVATDDVASTGLNTPVPIDVLDNDFDPEGEAITLQTAGVNPLNPIGGGTLQGGTATINNNGTPGDPTDDFINYTPPSNFIGQDTFYYKICDANIFNSQCDVAQVIVTVTSPIDVSLTKTVFPEKPDAGDNVTFTITLTNSSANNATSVVVKDQLPSGLTYVSDNGGGAYDSNTGVWYIGTVPAGSSTQLQIVATVTNFNNATNTAEVTAHNEFDTDSTPNNQNAGEDDQSTVILQCVLKRQSITVTPN